MTVSTHVLDVAGGRPAEGIPVKLDWRRPDGGWGRLGAGVTDGDGRVRELTGGAGREGVHRLTFDLTEWSAAGRRPFFYPEVTVTFQVFDAAQHHHVPLLLSPFGYTTYRGS